MPQLQLYTTDFHNLGGKLTNAWAADCAVVKIPEVFNVGGARAKKQLNNFRYSAQSLQEKFSCKPMVLMESV